LLSSNSVSRRGFVQRELKIALEVLSDLPPGKIFIIPVRLDANCIPTEEAIKDLHWINLFDSFEDGIRRILRVLKPSKSIKNQAKKNRIIKTKFRAPDIAQFQIEQSTRFLNAKLSFISMLQQIDLHYEFTNRKFSIF
jgi:hypothetical protein